MSKSERMSTAAMQSVLLGIQREIEAEALKVTERAQALEEAYQRVTALLQHVDTLPANATHTVRRPSLSASRRASISKRKVQPARGRRQTR